jgi:hypothetical protein
MIWISVDLLSAKLKGGATTPVTPTAAQPTNCVIKRNIKIKKLYDLIIINNYILNFL